MKMLLIVILGAQCPSHHSADQLYKSVNNEKKLSERAREDEAGFKPT